MPTSLGPAEILVVLVVALIVLGPQRLPEAGRQIGKALAEIRRWSSSMQTEIRDAFEVEPEREPQPPPAAAGPSPAVQPQPGPVGDSGTSKPPVGNGAGGTAPVDLPPEWASPPPERPPAGPSS